MEPLYKDIPERRISPLIYLDDNVIKHWMELTAPIPGCQLDEHKMELLKEYMYVVHGSRLEPTHLWKDVTLSSIKVLSVVLVLRH